MLFIKPKPLRRIRRDHAKRLINKRHSRTTLFVLLMSRSTNKQEVKHWLDITYGPNGYRGE